MRTGGYSPGSAELACTAREIGTRSKPGAPLPKFEKSHAASVSGPKLSPRSRERRALMWSRPPSAISVSTALQTTTSSPALTAFPAL